MVTGKLPPHPEGSKSANVCLRAKVESMYVSTLEGSTSQLLLCTILVVVVVHGVNEIVYYY